MKNLIISIICLLLLMVPWGIYDRFSSASTDHYKDVITNQTIPAAQSEDWRQAEESFDSITKDWDKFRKISAYFIDTESLNEVTAHMAKVSSYIQEKDKVNTVVEANDLQYRLEYLHENEAPSVDNVF